METANLCFVPICLWLQIFKPVDLLDDKRDFTAVLVTVQELYHIAAGTCTYGMYGTCIVLCMKT